MDDEVTPKRRRVTQACENCRALKSKCDGKKPRCNRCKGYGYTCRWKDRHDRHTRLAVLDNALPTPGEGSPGANGVAALMHSVQTSQDLLKQLRDKLDADDQEKIDIALAGPDVRLKYASLGSPITLQNRPDLLVTHTRQRPGGLANRYLGEVSDVSFFNSVKELLHQSPPGGRDGLQLESYEREGAESIAASEDGNVLLPDREAADSLVDIYFSTIHIAYPFVCRTQFMKDYQEFWDQGVATDEVLNFTPLLLTIFAIGSYYNVCTLSTEQAGAAMHSMYFRRAVLAACHLDSERSIENVCILLAQCFYLLATCQTDRAWTTLGFAIRLGQGIGLHVEETQPRSPVGESQVSQEFRRRTWWSLYVLDRLLSLQLGRPSAIRNRDCNLRLPSRLDDSEFDLGRDRVPDATGSEPQTGDYFIAVINFSVILGRVIRDIYCPSMTDYSENMLGRTDKLDAELVSWRVELPRWLRFDRGHTFERSAVLRRQRNMLAIKFHHLRALIHRPYLCLPWLQRNDGKIKALLETQAHRVVYSERICVKEAQDTAHMLHDVTDKKSLVEDFPWWQMISCMVCASSILLVMRTFASSTTVEEKLQRELLEEDADTCLKVFDALSINSDAARRARDMLQNLRESKGAKEVGSMLDGTSRISGETGPAGEASTVPANTSFPMPDSEPEQLSSFQSDDDLNGTSPMWNWQDWPSEIADSMTWSSQFVDTLDPAVLSGPSYE